MAAENLVRGLRGERSQGIVNPGSGIQADDGTGPSGLYWMAKDVLLTIWPDQEPGIALIDALAEMFFQNCIAWAES